MSDTLPAERDLLTLLRNKFRCEIASDGDYHKCGHVWHAPMFTIEETDSILAALLAARREEEAAQQRLSEIAVLCEQTEDIYCNNDGDVASFYASTLDKIAALATPEEK